jgi:HSP20 family molecular chaperone IbpA
MALASDFLAITAPRSEAGRVARGASFSAYRTGQGRIRYGLTIQIQIHIMIFMDSISWDSLIPTEDLFDDGFDLKPSQIGWDLATDVNEADDSVIVEIQLPGIKPDTYDIKLDDGCLVVSGKREESSETTDQNSFRQEIKRGSFVRRIPLPEGAYDASGITTAHENGTLKISLPKAS